MSETGIFGINVLDYWDARAVSAIVDLGVKWVRIDFNRQFVEPSSGVYSWSDFDTFMLAMQQHGVNVVGIISHTPTWISWTDWTDQAADVATFCGQLVQRYKPGGDVAGVAGWGSYGLSHWEVFNEPNLPGFGWLNEGDDYTTTIGNYASILHAAQTAIKATDPNAVVLMAGMSSSNDPSGWFTSFYTYSPQADFDVANFHPYGFDGEFPQAATGAQTVMNANGDGAKPIWFTEFGTPDTTQASSYLADAWAQRNSAAAVFWFCLTDSGDTSGLMDASYNRRPIYAQFRSLMPRHTYIVLQSSASVAAGGTVTSSVANLTDCYGGIVTVQITNGSTGPSTPCNASIQVSGDNTNFFTIATTTEDTSASATTTFCRDVPPGTMYVRVQFTGNSGQAVTVSAQVQILSTL